MLHNVLSKKKAVILVCCGWFYSIFIVLLHVFIQASSENVQANSTQDCFKVDALFHKIPSTIFAISVICLVAMVAILQTMTYWKLWKRQQMAIGSIVSTNGMTRMYKRAMVTSSLIATAFLIGWLPFTISVLLNNWSNVNEEKSQQISSIIATLGIIQSFCNAIIFKLRNMDYKLSTGIKRICLN